jgi:ABC-2 type transport system permease protein
MLAKPLAFLQRDLRIAMTYRLSFVQSVLTLAIGLVSVDFVSRFVNEGSPPTLAEYDNDYFGFALVGMAIALFVQSIVGLFAGAVRSAQVTGTLDVILGSRTTCLTFLGGSALYGFLYAFVKLIAALLIGSLLIGPQPDSGGMLVAVAALVLTTAAFTGVGILSAAFVVLFKQREPFTAAFITLSLLLGGVLYPTSVMPSPLEQLANWLPLTHAVDAMRAALLQQQGFSTATEHLAVLLAFATLLPLGTIAFEFAVRSARASGSLSHY